MQERNKENPNKINWCRVIKVIIGILLLYFISCAVYHKYLKNDILIIAWVVLAYIFILTGNLGINFIIPGIRKSVEGNLINNNNELNKQNIDIHINEIISGIRNRVEKLESEQELTVKTNDDIKIIMHKQDKRIKELEFTQGKGQERSRPR